MGTFFCRFATFLMEQGKQVRKINFNAGDAFFYCHKDQMDNYRGKVADFDVFLADIIQKYDIDAVVCFNDCRPYHAIASRVTTNLGVSFFVFEEGYLRPDYITLEKHGINGYSRLNPELIDTLKKPTTNPNIRRIVFGAYVFQVSYIILRCFLGNGATHIMSIIVV